MGSSGYDAFVRTTLTLDPDVVQRLKGRVAAGNASFKQVVNDTLRRGLAAEPKPKPKKPFRVIPIPGGFKPGIDPHKLNQLLDQLEVEDFVAKERRNRVRR